MPSHTIITRHWLLLSAIPRAPRKIDTATLEARLQDHGVHVSRRSIQRDLHALSAIFPLTCDERSKPYGWSWMRDAAPFDLPAMDPRTAMTFRLVGSHLSKLMPRCTWRELEPHLQRATAVLAALGDNALARWPGKLRVIPDFVVERPPHVDAEVLDAVYAALLEERMLRADYRSRGAEHARSLDVHPLGLLFRGPLVYLACVAEGRELVITLVLSRVVRAEVLVQPRREPPGFDLDAYLASGEPGFLFSRQPVSLLARAERVAAHRLYEAPPGRNTSLQDDGPSHVLLRTELPDSHSTRSWLLSYGSALEVLEPGWLREEIAAELATAAACYD